MVEEVPVKIVTLVARDSFAAGHTLGILVRPEENAFLRNAL
jgi:hypothetical protein